MRDHDPGVQGVHRQGCRARRGVHHDRHAPPRAPQRPRERCPQTHAIHLQRVQGGSQTLERRGERRVHLHRLRRRQVPPGYQLRPTHAPRRSHPPLLGRQPEPPRGGEHRRRWQNARQAVLRKRQQPKETHGRVAPRRRRLQRPGDRVRDPGHVPAARVHHRRYHSHRGEQPGGVHHRPEVLSIEPLLHRRGQMRRRAGVPRQWRRRRGRRSRDGARHRVEAGVRARRRRGYRLLPQVRAQRNRRADVHAAADVQEDQDAPIGSRAVLR
mmetsp:Transcript_13710/g.58036  ORF Transcript_13710/g.58036 Transcript_13710/m.58036 type:complete len:269 (-) Transcript_13710:1556-2362(-)